MKEIRMLNIEKRDLLEDLFHLNQKEILDIIDILNGYKERINKSKKDTLLMRYMFARGYHSSKEFYDKNNITKDSGLAKALNYETTNIKTYLKLKELLNMDDEDFSEIIEELKGDSDE